jgi:hypothetical protein
MVKTSDLPILYFFLKDVQMYILKFPNLLVTINALGF